ncbi:MAG: right-handed parallel beta-helix repeat-containing protein [Candidatus Abyssobacteria bacterium SURF_5]|uniref:Right-handed parallel beta-helix repeat-containing protein n=1 Tax=Abyssobacteria bacterium (strain SURF_5) TaxID=2093360 RepID=A0A3A4NBI7_ABYX5|nr:MAG: right-handed parallel beta-helix repeat-containing protein [Candidatus Abyssubacteria bacterium SURF_5]
MRWDSRRKVFLIVLVFIFVFGPRRGLAAEPGAVAIASAPASAVYVPDDFPTIQAALNAVTDIYVIVRDGIYTGAENKNLDFQGKPIKLVSENGAANCIIDCQGDGRGFYFHSGEGADSAVSGFTIRNGMDGETSEGGGIFCERGASPTITNCTITACAANFGGAISCRDSSPIISACTLTANEAMYGGGIYSTNSSPLISGCTIETNSAEEGGGVFLIRGAPIIAETILRNNLADNGGGIVTDVDCTPTFWNCLIENNAALWWGGGFFCSSSFVNISNCTVRNNTAGWGGGGFHSYQSHNNVTNSIFWGNSALLGNEIALQSYDSTAFESSDVEGGKAAAYVEPEASLYWLESNISADPMFSQGPLGSSYLSQTDAGQASDSPCVDAGNDEALLLGLQMLTTRSDQLDATGVGDAGIVDMGYHYPIVEVTGLQEISLISPADGAALSAPPLFVWTPDGGTRDAFAIEVSTSAAFTSYYSTYENLSQILTETQWAMPSFLWSKVPAGVPLYWRVRGIDLDSAERPIVTSNEIWSFQKN